MIGAIAVTVNGRSSSKVAASTVFGMPVVLLALNTLPVPSSLIVPSPFTGVPPGLATTRLNVSPAGTSRVGSFVTAVRTNNPPAGIFTKVSGM